MHRINKKINWLTEQTKNPLDVEAIRYKYSLSKYPNNPNPDTSNNVNGPPKLSTGLTRLSFEKIKIKIESEFYNRISESSLHSIRDNWIVNLSPITIPKDIQCLLQHGESFSLPSYN